MSRKFDSKLRTSIEKATFTHHYHQSLVSEQFRTLRTNITILGIDNGINTIMVTSPNREEGKTTTVTNLSIVLAQQGKKVLLIDANLRNPSLHQLFGNSNTIGLSNILSGKSHLDTAIYDSGIYNLKLLPSGPIPPNPSDLLSSNIMKEIVWRVGQEYDIVLLDTPPILDVSDAQLVGNQCQGAVLVLKSGKTSREEAVKAKELLLNTKAKILGASLSEGRPKIKA